MDDPRAMNAFFRTCTYARNLRVSTTLQALWLVRHRPVTSLLEAARKAEPHLREGVMLKLLRLPCLPAAALTATTEKEQMSPLVRRHSSTSVLLCSEHACLLQMSRYLHLEIIQKNTGVHLR